jgi:hypothetical protein
MRLFSYAAAVAAIAVGVGSALAGEATNDVRALPVKDGKIAYVLINRHWAVFQSPDGKTECPEGLNEGAREQFREQFPDDGTKRTVIETQLMREGRIWSPDPGQDPFKFKEAGGTISYGMNLDGKVKEADFTSPDGEKGIDNQLFRAIGCIDTFREHGMIYDLEDQYVRRYTYNRLVIEISGVHNLVNDDNVTVKSYRGDDDILTTADGEEFLPGGTQHIDTQWGKFVQSTWKGKIVNGVLITEPADLTLPVGGSFGTTPNHKLRGLRFKLRLTPEGAEGLMAGYVDVDRFIQQMNISWATGCDGCSWAVASLHGAMKRLADGYPDPKTGAMTAISSALLVKFGRVFIMPQSQQEVAATPKSLENHPR